MTASNHFKLSEWLQINWYNLLLTLSMVAYYFFQKDMSEFKFVLSILVHPIQIWILLWEANNRAKIRLLIIDSFISHLWKELRVLFATIYSTVLNSVECSGDLVSIKQKIVKSWMISWFGKSKNFKSYRWRCPSMSSKPIESTSVAKKVQTRHEWLFTQKPNDKPQKTTVSNVYRRN